MAPLTRRQKKALAAAPPPPDIQAQMNPADRISRLPEAIQAEEKALAATPRPPVIDPADRISQLPDVIRSHILSFVPADEAVRTCVLARTWRKDWKSTRRLLITGKSVQDVAQFVDRLLHARGKASLDATEMRFIQVREATVDDEHDATEIRFIQDKDGGGRYADTVVAALDDDDNASLIRWIGCVLECQTKMLQIDISADGDFNAYLHIMDNKVLVSRHLTTKLELTGVWFYCRWLNLDGCPALEHLEITKCCLRGVRKMTSLSVKHLIITSCDSIEDHKRIQICFPRVVSLWLDVYDVRTPLLERMPDLVEANVKISSFQDYCNCDDLIACYHVTRAGDTSSDIDSDSDEDKGSGDYARQNTNCVVLEGLAQARDLVLIDDCPTYIFRRDLRWCPTFFNLKTLKLIQEYSREPADCSVLECMLQHAPLLEKLTFILEKVGPPEKYIVEIKGYPDTKVTSTKISQHLQIVRIVCEGVNGISVNVLNLLHMLNIRGFETTLTKRWP